MITMPYTPVAQKLCTLETLGKAPPGHYLALNVAHLGTTCRISLGTIPHRVIDPEATTNYHMFSPLLTPEGMNGETRQQICTLECEALDKACQEINASYAKAGIPCAITSNNFFLLLNGRVIFAPTHPLKF